MLKGMKKLSAAFASSVLLAASTLVATPAPAQTGSGGGAGCYCLQWSHLGGCGYWDEDGNWRDYTYDQCCYYYPYYIIGPPPPECGGGYEYQPSEDPAVRPSDEPSESPGQ